MPNRIIKESVCTSDTIDQMSWFEECFFTRLWTACDDYGRMDARPAILKSKLFPLKDRLSLKDIESALYKLADIGCVMLYERDSKPYLYLPSWEVHQQVRAKRSKYPAPGNARNHMISDDIKCPRNPIQSESESESESDARPCATDKRANFPNQTGGEQVYSDGFDTFWAAYPRKSGYIDRAYQEYLVAIDSGATLEEMLSAMEWQRKEWGAQGGRYTPSAEKWLHNRGWTEKQPETDDAPAAETDAEKLEHMRRMYASMTGVKEKP